MMKIVFLNKHKILCRAARSGYGKGNVRIKTKSIADKAIDSLDFFVQITFFQSSYLRNNR